MSNTIVTSQFTNSDIFELSNNHSNHSTERSHIAPPEEHISETIIDGSHGHTSLFDFSNSNGDLPLKIVNNPLASLDLISGKAKNAAKQTDSGNVDANAQPNASKPRKPPGPPGIIDIFMKSYNHKGAPKEDPFVKELMHGIESKEYGWRRKYIAYARTGTIPEVLKPQFSQMESFDFYSECLLCAHYKLPGLRNAFHHAWGVSAKQSRRKVKAGFLNGGFWKRGNSKLVPVKKRKKPETSSEKQVQKKRQAEGLIMRPLATPQYPADMLLNGEQIAPLPESIVGAEI